MAEFDRWAPFYDLVNEGLPGEAEFYVGNAVRSGGAVLELGAGTGRLAIPMAMSGVRVIALDNAVAMLQVLQEQERSLRDMPGRVWPVAGDMRALAFDHCFAYIAMAYRTFMHLENDAERLACLTGVARHLAPGGRFMANVWRPARGRLAEIVPAHARWRVAGTYPVGEGDSLIHRFRAKYDSTARRMAEEHHFIVRNNAQNIVWEEKVPLTRYWCEPREICALMNTAGLVVEALFRDFDCNPWREDAEEAVFVCQKA
jgi:SAM-dependent methyltransferase